MSIEIELASAQVLFTSRADGDFGRTGEPAPVPARERALIRCGKRAIVAGHQVHGAHVATVAGTDDRGYAIAREADGQATSSAEVAIAVHVADCLPVVVAGAGTVAVLHAGWRGLAAGVLESGCGALRALGERGPLHAAIGPGAGGCCYEAGEEVQRALGLTPAGRRAVDLKTVARERLQRLGVATIEDVGLCTICTPTEMLFSHRRDGPQTGRQAAIAWLR